MGSLHALKRGEFIIEKNLLQPHYKKLDPKTKQVAELASKLRSFLDTEAIKKRQAEIRKSALNARIDQRNELTEAERQYDEQLAKSDHYAKKKKKVKYS